MGIHLTLVDSTHKAPVMRSLWGFRCYHPIHLWSSSRINGVFGYTFTLIWHKKFPPKNRKTITASDRHIPLLPSSHLCSDYFHPIRCVIRILSMVRGRNRWDGRPIWVQSDHNNHVKGSRFALLAFSIHIHCVLLSDIQIHFDGSICCQIILYDIHWIFDNMCDPGKARDCYVNSVFLANDSLLISNSKNGLELCINDFLSEKWWTLTI